MSELAPASNPDAIANACQVLSAGLPVGLPTDASYVLAVDPFAAGASDRLFATLRRPRTQDLPVLVATIFQAESFTTSVPEAARKLMRRCWPGPLTLVLPRHPELAADLGDDDLTVGLRMSGNEAARELCARYGPVAVATATAGPGEPALQTATEVFDVFFDSVPLVLDGGTCSGLAATVIDATGTDPHLIREGRLPWPDILEAIKD